MNKELQGGGLRSCMSNKFPAETDTADAGTTLWNQWIETQMQKVGSALHQLQVSLWKFKSVSSSVNGVERV